VTDTNIGFNKTNAVVQVSLTYDVDLTDLGAPQATLVATHTNHADPNVPCIHWNQGEITSEPGYPINRCYWNYLRVYKQAGAELLEATPHAIPANQIILEEPVPARVDDLEDEDLEGVRGFGTLMVVPGGEALNTAFRFALPPEVLLKQGEITYPLTVRKQPGTLAVPLVIRIHLPNRARLLSLPEGAVLQDNHLLLETDLQRDVEIELVFQLQ
jgi:hypothetical protein